MFAPAADALALLAAAATSLSPPPLPSWEDGPGAFWSWIQAANSDFAITDSESRWVFGGFTIPILLLFEGVGIRKDWKLYPFLVPFWLIFGSVSLGLIGGVAATAAHVVLFPIGRTWFMLRDRRRAREAPVPPPAGAPVHGQAPAARPRRKLTGEEILRSALAAVQSGVEERIRARPPGAPEPAWGPVMREIVSALGKAAGVGPAGGTQKRPPPLEPPGTPQPPAFPSRAGPQGPLASERPPHALGGSPAKPDASAFRPDMSRFRRRPPHS